MGASMLNVCSTIIKEYESYSPSMQLIGYYVQNMKKLESE